MSTKYTMEQFIKDLKNNHIEKSFMYDLLDKYYKNLSDNATEFDYNIHNALYCYDANNEVIRRTKINRKYLGIVAYAFVGAMRKYDKEKANAIRIAEKEKMAKTSDYYGEIGDKFKGKSVRVTLISTRGFETQFGYTYVYTMRNYEGNTFVWFSSNSIWGMLDMERNRIRNESTSLEDFKNNERNLYLMSIQKSLENNSPVRFDIVGGTIKEHKDYTDKDGVTTKQTIITRCKLDNFEVVQ